MSDQIAWTDGKSSTGVPAKRCKYRGGRGRPQITPEQFWAKSIPDHVSGCRVWTWGRKTRGYGAQKIGTETKAHRIAWIFHYGPIPRGMFVCHRCDRTCCVEPLHLFLGTNADNMADMSGKGRSGLGISLETVRQIRERYALGGISQRALANEFGIRQQAVCDMVTGKSYRSTFAPESRSNLESLDARLAKLEATIREGGAK